MAVSGFGHRLFVLDFWYHAPMLETIDTPTRRHKAQLALLGCCLSVFWNGCIAFGFPGVMGSYWQEQFGVGQGQVGLVVTCELFALACSMFSAERCIWPLECTVALHWLRLST